MTQSLYRFFDDIVCINLDSRKDRRKGTQKVFDLLNISGRYHTVSRHPKGGMYGCFDSHIQVIKEAYDKGLSNLLVFEDDIKITPTYSNKQVHECVEFMKNNNEWDIFYLGYFPSNTTRGSMKDFIHADFINEHIIKYGPLAAHAYCVSRRGMKRILENYEVYIGRVHYDVFLVGLKLESYCVVPFLFDQYLCLTSDNSPEDNFEIFIRKFQCNAETYHLMYRPTLMKYNLHKHKKQCLSRIVIMSFIITLFVFIIIYLFKSH